MSVKLLSILAIVLSLSSVVFNFYNNNKIGYVDNQQLLMQYEGYKDAQIRFEQKEKERQSNLKAIEEDLKLSFEKYELSKDDLGEKELLEMESVLQRKRQNLIDARAKYNRMSSEENQSLINGISLRIENQIKKYAEKNGYDHVIGITELGNVLYSDERKNITEELIQAINDEYEGV